MTVNQISIFLENKYGKLSEILALLAEERIRIIAATVAAPPSMESFVSS